MFHFLIGSSKIKTMKSFFGFCLFAFGMARLAASLECPACDASSCPYGFSGELDKKGCPTCECLKCKVCPESCLFGFKKFNAQGCPDCSTCLKEPASSCDEIECIQDSTMCEERKFCLPNKPEICSTSAYCIPKTLKEYHCTRICPAIMELNIPLTRECKLYCKASDLMLCDEANCKEDEHCVLENLRKRQHPKAICVKNICDVPSYCGLDCDHGIERVDSNCPTCKCKVPTCKDLKCGENYECIEETECQEDGQKCQKRGKCVPATCAVVECAEGFVCQQKDIVCVSPPCKERLPKCVLETCDLLECGPAFKCINSKENCPRDVCPKCVPMRDCSEVTCEDGDVCKMVKPECPECKCPEGASENCVPNTHDCNKDCEKPYAQCQRDCEKTECPKKCQFGCLKDKNGCYTNLCAPPSNCEQVECKTGEKCEVIHPDCDSDGPCTEKLAQCVKHCPELSCTDKHDLCEWGLKKDKKGCPTCECQKPKACDQIKCHVDERCLPSEDSYSCQPCALVDSACGSDEEYVVAEDGCYSGTCAPRAMCERKECPEGKECQMVKRECKGEKCQRYEPVCVCHEQNCRMFCENGFKINPLTGCEICECNERMPSCDDIRCPKGKKCVMPPVEKNHKKSISKPICFDCPVLDLCPTCPDNHKREIDQNGCETCKCKPDCTETFCDIECGFVGYRIDENGCRTCDCNPTKPCDLYTCRDELECRKFMKNGEIVRFCKNEDGDKTDVTPVKL